MIGFLLFLQLVAMYVLSFYWVTGVAIIFAIDIAVGCLIGLKNAVR